MNEMTSLKMENNGGDRKNDKKEENKWIKKNNIPYTHTHKSFTQSQIRDIFNRLAKFIYTSFFFIFFLYILIYSKLFSLSSSEQGHTVERNKNCTNSYFFLFAKK
jgi:hypothetical protein